MILVGESIGGEATYMFNSFPLGLWGAPAPATAAGTVRADTPDSASGQRHYMIYAEILIADWEC